MRFQKQQKTICNFRKKKKRQGKDDRKKRKKNIMGGDCLKTHSSQNVS